AQPLVAPRRSVGIEGRAGSLAPAGAGEEFHNLLLAQTPARCPGASCVGASRFTASRHRYACSSQRGQQGGRFALLRQRIAELPAAPAADRAPAVRATRSG